ncbi:hypothetical protein GCM10010269_83910 [Streptomyces humidus]|uniref:Uncharacterized protein n=1 Tax=Streptomyces humidus TaxID=52259 RepID=A0A918GG88_9ACTN|nr:hypothetical protein [Streptomyces humidus]GGS34146.1 hypothetical protein GCM10010269_83910 [Streptomyces humidus]
MLHTTDDAVNLTIYKFPDVALSPNLPDSHGTVLWQATYPRPAFAHAVLEAAHTVLTEHGEAGYLAKWAMHPYLVPRVQGLRRLHMRDDVCDLPHGISCP